jgi:hypothetical protein
VLIVCVAAGEACRAETNNLQISRWRMPRRSALENQYWSVMEATEEPCARSRPQARRRRFRSEFPTTRYRQPMTPQRTMTQAVSHESGHEKQPRHCGCAERGREKALSVPFVSHFAAIGTRNQTDGRSTWGVRTGDRKLRCVGVYLSSGIDARLFVSVTNSAAHNSCATRLP